MHASIPLTNEEGTIACALRITRSTEGRVQVCKTTEAGAVMGATVDVSSEAFHSLEHLGFGQTCWLPTQDEPQFRMTGQGKVIEVRENRASAEPLFIAQEALSCALIHLHN